MNLPVLPSLRRRLIVLTMAAAAATTACAKDHEFFALVDDLIEGEIAARVTGAPAGASVSLSGQGIQESQVVDAAGGIFEDLPPGTYQLSVQSPTGYLCTPNSITVTLSRSAPTGVAEFHCTPLLGMLSFNVAGLYDDQFALPINLTGSTTRQLQLGNGLGIADNLGIGQLNWAVGAFPSHDCLPLNGSFNVLPGGEYTQSIDCTPVKGSAHFTMSGLYSDLYKLSVEYSGVTSGSFQLGNGSVDLDDIDFGSLQWNATPLSSHDCTPLSGNLVFLPGTDITIPIGCQPKPGSITAVVSGTTAQVNYTGPTTGGGAVGSTPVVFGGLQPGAYNVAIVVPDDFECAPATVSVQVEPAGNAMAEFECTPEEEEEEELVEYSVDLQGFVGSPGAVPAGSYNRPVLDNLLNQVALLTIATIGTQTFYGTSPARLGFNGTSGYELDALFPVAAMFFRLRALQICTINAALSGSNFLLIQYYTAAAVLLGTAQITGSPGCFWLDVPATTRFVRMLGPAVGFVDIHGLLLRGVLAP